MFVGSFVKKWFCALLFNYMNCKEINKLTHTLSLYPVNFHNIYEIADMAGPNMLAP